MAFFFVASWLVLLVFAIRSMRRGVKAAAEYEAASEFRNRKLKEERRYVTKTMHPEMEDVEDGDELLIVKFGEEEKKDPLLQSLENRITELNDRDDEDDDDGDVVVRV